MGLGIVIRHLIYIEVFSDEVDDSLAAVPPFAVLENQ